MTRKSIQCLGAASALAMAVSLACAGGASAQGATSTLRGTIYEGQSVETGGSITATEVATIYVSRGRIGDDGGYVLSGLRPGLAAARCRIGRNGFAASLAGVAG